MEKLLFGTAGIPTITTPRNYNNALYDIIDLNLGCMEIEFVRGVNMNAKTQQEVKKLSENLKVVLTAHGPYYINLNSPESEKVNASIKRILDTARVAYACGGYSITFHAAFYMGMDKKEVYKVVKSRIEKIVETLKSENIQIWIRPETTGKLTQWGDLDEVIKLSQEVDMVLPCIDFAHLHARFNGKYNTYKEFSEIFEQIGSKLGSYALENFHAHIAGINYGEKGEKNHLIFKESDFNYKELAKALKNFNIKGTIICESPNLEGDAILLQEEYINA